jgi:formamidopyrimidine-DNA glycosylase
LKNIYTRHKKEIDMLEIPEANTLAGQINDRLIGKTVQSVVAASSPLKFAWYHGDPLEYPSRLNGIKILSACAAGGMVEIQLTRSFLVFTDGVNLRFHPSAGSLPQKHQLRIVFSDGSALSASVQMYGGLMCWTKNDVYDNPYYLAAKEKPSPLSQDFDEAYFRRILSGDNVQNLSLKAALATQQRIPGLGNGVLQDILWKAEFSPRRKLSTLTESNLRVLFTSVTQILTEMTRKGGRDTEKDLFGEPGGYAVAMSAKNNGCPCPRCGTAITKEAYLGGSIYYCRQCQK